VLEIFGFGAGFNLVIPYDKNNLNIADNPLSNKGFLTGTFGAGFSIDDFFKFGATAAFSKILESKEEVPIAFATGLQFLPFDWFSLGAFGKMANAQFLEPWQFNIGATFRPAKKYLDLSFNAKFFPKSLNWLDGFSYHPGAMIGVNIEKFSIRFNVEVMDIESGFDKLNFMLGFAYMFDHAGLETIGGMSTDGYLTTTGQFYLHTGEEQGTKSAENNEDIL